MVLGEQPPTRSGRLDLGVGDDAAPLEVGQVGSRAVGRIPIDRRPLDVAAPFTVLVGVLAIGGVLAVTAGVGSFADGAVVLTVGV